ncbi:Nck-associated protein 1 [Blyttiomyces helicus]|uniref:Nck-associated protein 1 n=1 Tax=Blyttiomyces helicus TaxID=388810 RepID=A0A4P9W3D8_9FUNG|nr:Nck-associated protein 1 [Blyttiomyces helicus]|eukprot:RKO86322.1 Nck-associated protein 1 [Blyttiomyces helicus]
MSRLARFLTSYEKPIPVIQEQLTAMAPKICALLIEKKSDLDQRLCMTADGFRKLAILSLTPEMSGVKAPEPDEKQLHGLTTMNREYAMIVIGLLVCPTELVKNTAAIDLLKQTLTYGFMLPIMFNIAAEYEQTAKAHSKLGKLKNTVSEALAASSVSSQLFHKERREFLRHQMKQILCLIPDTRMLCSKFSVIATAMGFAKDEILWYFHHFDRDAIGKRKGKKEAKVFDLGVVEMIWQLIEVRKHLKKNVDTIRGYIANQMAQYSVPVVIELIELALGAPEVKAENTGLLLEAIIRTVEKIPTEEADEVFRSGGLEALRLNWLRFQLSAALPSSSALIANATELTSAMGDLYKKSSWIDAFAACIDRLSSLKILYFYQGPLHEHLKECMDSAPDQIRFAGCLGVLAEEFILNATDYWPAEYKPISSHSVLYATELYSILGQYAANVAHDIALHTITHHLECLPHEAVAFLQRQTGVDRQKKKTGGGIVGIPNLGRKHVTDKAVQKPGWESALKGDASVRNLERLKQLLRNVLHTLHHTVSTRIHTTEFHPIEYFLESFAAKFKSHIQTIVYKQAENQGRGDSGGAVDDSLSFDVRRPTLFLNEVKAYMSAVRMIDGLVPVDCTSCLREVLLDQIDYEKAQAYADSQPDQMVYQPGTAKAKAKDKGKGPVINTGQSALVTYMAWYGDVCGDVSRCKIMYYR